jgi:hypothetical protein
MKRVVMPVQDVIENIGGAARQAERAERKYPVLQQSGLQHRAAEKWGKEEHEVLQPLIRTEQF